MNYSVFTELDWLYPDSAHSRDRTVCLSVPRGGHAGAQVLAETPSAPVSLHFSWQGGEGPRVRLYQLAPVGVNENTSPTLMTTTDYESCRAFVTRKAPFEVYDALRPAEEGLAPGRLALYLAVQAAPEAVPGLYEGALVIREGGGETLVPVRCRVRGALVPPPGAGRFGMLNFFDYDNLAAQHGVEKGGREYWRLFRAYLRAQVDMRCTHILLPPGEAVFRAGELVGFDFSAAETAGRIALEEGAAKLCGGHIAHWRAWDDSEYYPLWDGATGISTPKGYLQLRLYFSQWAQAVRRNGWQACMTQALADEPQTHNEGAYRILAAMFRKFLPGVPIIDAVETTNLGGGVDIWVPKQDTYEKWRGEYEALKAAGEEMWFYTCAFPAGRIMNRSMDLPLTASRAVLWMGALYRLSGFLHWGFNFYIGQDLWHSACCPHKGALLPAGDAHIVYPGPGGPWPSLRFMAQRAGAEDCELLLQAIAAAPEKTDALIRRVCTSFRDYTSQGSTLLAAREELFTLLESEEWSNG